MVLQWPWIGFPPVVIRWSHPADFVEKKVKLIVLHWRGHQIMAKGVAKPPPPSTWVPHCSTGKRGTISVLRILNDLKRIPCAAGARSPRVCATTGVDGGNPICRIHLVPGHRKSPFKVTYPLFHIIDFGISIISVSKIFCVRIYASVMSWFDRKLKLRCYFDQVLVHSLFCVYVL